MLQPPCASTAWNSVSQRLLTKAQQKQRDCTEVDSEMRGRPRNPDARSFARKSAVAKHRRSDEMSGTLTHCSSLGANLRNGAPLRKILGGTFPCAVCVLRSRGRIPD